MLPTDVGALDVRDVVALDPERGPGSPSASASSSRATQRLALVGHPARLLAGEGLAGIAGREGHQLALLAALRDGQPDGPPRRDARNASRSAASGRRADETCGGIEVARA